MIGELMLAICSSLVWKKKTLDGRPEICTYDDVTHPPTHTLFPFFIKKLKVLNKYLTTS